MINPTSLKAYSGFSRLIFIRNLQGHKHIRIYITLDEIEEFQFYGYKTEPFNLSFMSKLIDGRFIKNNNLIPTRVSWA